MKIIAFDKVMPDTTQEKIYSLLKEEVTKVWELYRTDFFREIYFRKDRGGVVLIMECTDISEARNVLNTLPFVQAGLIDFEIIPVGAFLPLATLFAQENKDVTNLSTNKTETVLSK